MSDGGRAEIERFVRDCESVYGGSVTLAYVSLCLFFGLAIFLVLYSEKIGPTGKAVWAFLVLLGGFFSIRSLSSEISYFEEWLPELTQAIHEVLFERGLWLEVLEKDVPPTPTFLAGLSPPTAKVSIADRLRYLRLNYPRLCEEKGLFAFSEGYQRELDFKDRRPNPITAPFVKIWVLALGRAVETELLQAKETGGSGTVDSSGL